ncbi:MAG: class I SAM-dependent methyltransferase [candidate division KSB1 bacterium]
MSLWAWKAPLYSFIRAAPLFHQLLRAEKNRLARVLQLAPPPKLHLDIGSGTGDSLSLFHASPRLVCLDASLAMLRRLAHQPKLLAHAEHLPFAACSFDLVSALGVLEYVKDEARFFNEAFRVLRPEGFFLFTSAPRVPANYLRLLWGERLYLRNAQQVRASVSTQCWRLIAHERTFLQEQWLLQRLALQE